MSNLCKCLIDTIGLRAICEDREACILYLNDIPGISNQAFAYLRDIENQTAQEVFEKVEGNGIDKLYYDLIARAPFKKKKKQKKHTTGKFKRPNTLVTTEDYLSGFVVNTANSDYLELEIGAFKIHSQAAITDFLYVFDLETGELLEKIEFTFSQANTTRFELSGKAYSSSEKLFIAYNKANVQTYTTEAKATACFPYCLACQCAGTGGFYKLAHGGDPDSLSPEFSDLIRDTEGGLILEYKMTCSFSKWMCDYREELAPLLRLSMGMCFFDEIPGVLGKLNKLTLMPREDRIVIQDIIKDQYDTAIDDFIKGLNPDCCCFENDSKYFKRQQLP